MMDNPTYFDWLELIITATLGVAGVVIAIYQIKLDKSQKKLVETQGNLLKTQQRVADNLSLLKSEISSLTTTIAKMKPE